MTRATALLAVAAVVVAVSATPRLGKQRVGALQLYTGDQCTLKNGAGGVCRPYRSCVPAQQAVKSGGIPVLCSFEGRRPVVCCPEAAPTGEPRKVSGDKCTLKGGDEGVCRPFNACSAAQDAWKSSGSLVYCSRQQSPLTVCCPRDVSAVSRKATKMCAKYAEAVYVRRVSPVLLPNAAMERVDTCVLSGAPFIVGGEAVKPDEFPHMALLGYRKQKRRKWLCGGTLISERYILTAAHCLKTSLGPPFVVRLGERDVMVDNELNKQEDFGVEKVVVHPGYKKHYNDVGLVRLDREVRFTASIRPACLNAAPVLTSKTAVATGWGLTDWADSETSDVLMKVNLTVHKGNECADFYKARLSRGFDKESMVCAGHSEGGKDTCKGDSGGPLQTRHRTHYCMYTIVAITNFGPKCGAANAPAVYARVSYFLPWIESIVWPGEV